LDHPVTQARKRELIGRWLGVVPPNVTYVPIDFMTQPLDSVMPGSGYRREATTFFICEGVTHYLSTDAVDALFGYVARGAGPGSRMVFTYIHRGILDGSATFAGAAETIASVRRAGEPYTFGFDPGELPRYLTTRRLGLVEDIDAATYRERYLAPVGRGHEAPSEFQHAALVETLEHSPAD
jgi:methyltransferase (TIGR00027 family)